MGNIFSILIAALFAEAIWETGKLLWQEGKLNVDNIGALLVGLLLAVGAKLDICSTLGLKFAYPVIGQILTGVLLSRGANFIHDFMKTAEKISR